ncbi:MAG: hypothetical protein V1873_00710 [Verrucomicrobiota bacterium]
MDYEPWFDSRENRALLAICARRLIKNTGIGSIVWGALNMAVGLFAVGATLLNLGILVLGLLMLGAGIYALTKRSLNAFLAETVVAILLFLWNLGISILNYVAFHVVDPRGLVVPLLIAWYFYKHYSKLQHLKEQIESVEPAQMKATKDVCKTLLKKKLKEEPAVIQTSDGKCRAQLLEDTAFFVQRDLLRAFVAPKQDVQKAIAKPDAKGLKVSFSHPVEKLNYSFDRKNSDKIRAWLSAMAAPAGS